MLVMGLILGEAILIYFGGVSNAMLEWIALRTVYLGWLFLSMVPVIGLEAKPRGLEA